MLERILDLLRIEDCKEVARGEAMRIADRLYQFLGPLLASPLELGRVARPRDECLNDEGTVNSAEVDCRGCVHTGLGWSGSGT